MKLYHALFVGLVVPSASTGQDTVFYRVACGPDNIDWRDSSFVVAATDPSLIAQADAELLLPEEDRSILHITVAAGSGGFNENGPHVFNWHAVVDGWALTEVCAEILDGRPYSDVELNLPAWPVFCPWCSRLIERLGTPLNTKEPVIPRLRVMPNPTTGAVRVGTEDGVRPLRIDLMDTHGRTLAAFHNTSLIDLGMFASGSYVLRIVSGSGSISALVMKD